MILTNPISPNCFRIWQCGEASGCRDTRILHWPPITAETLTAAVVIGFIGGGLWKTACFQGLGDNLVAVFGVIVVVWVMGALQKCLERLPSGSRRCCGGF